MIETKKLPFFVSEEEKAGLKNTPQGNMADQLKGAVPAFTDVECGDVLSSFGMKDGLLIYHFYKRDRKKIYDDAQMALAETRDPSRQNDVARNANAKLDQNPWWPGIDEVLRKVFSDHFKYTDMKITYYPEVDSWSVIMPEPRSAVMPPSHLAEVVDKVSQQVEG